MDVPHVVLPPSLSSAYGMVRERYGIGAGVPVGVMGGSLGGAVAQLLAAEGGQATVVDRLAVEWFARHLL